MEYFDVYDAEGHFLNKTVSRGSKLNQGEFVNVVHVWIKTKDDNFLIQQRNKKNDPIPYQWATTSGLPNPKESPLDAAVRETKEELGLNLNKTDLQKVAYLVSSHNGFNTLTHVYLTTADFTLDQINLNVKEVRDYDFKTLDEIKALIEKQYFWNYSKLLNVADYFSYLEEG